jgi:arylsulfatase A-like enzyme
MTPLSHNALILSLCVTVLAPWVCVEAASPDRTKRPNIIIILADDLGYSDIGCFGGDVHTPNLDALAKEGLRFTNFYNDARCCPTRASLLTGLYPHLAGVGDMNERTKLLAYSGALRPTVPTIAEVLKSSGYKTVHFGKWHVANTLERPMHTEDLNRQSFPDVFAPIEQYPTRRGFDEYWGGIWGVVNYFNPFALVDGEKPVKDLPADFYMTDAINEHAANYIARQKGVDQPFFMYLAHNAPHWPLHSRPEDVAKYRGQYNDGFEAVRRSRYRRMIELGIIDPKIAPLSEPVATKWEAFSPDQKRFQSALFQAHAAMIDRMDQGLGRVFQALKDAGKWNDTLIVFLSDNGASDERYENPGYDRATIARDGQPIDYHYDDLRKLAGPEHTWYYIGPDWAHVANTLYRKAKASQYNGGERTPMIAHWPAGIKAPPGSLTSARGHVIDLMATAMDLAGAKLPEHFAGATPHPIQGLSLRPLFDGNPDRPNYPALYGEHEGGRSVITPNGWKLIKDRGEKDWHLYNLNVDQTEMTDLIGQESARAAKMRAMWDRWAKENQVLPKP